MEGMQGSILKSANMVPEWFSDTETQAVIIVGLCAVGAWVVFQWIMQILFSAMWPFFLVTAILMYCPSWRENIANNYLPKHIEAFRTWTDGLTNRFNATTCQAM